MKRATGCNGGLSPGMAGMRRTISGGSNRSECVSPIPVGISVRSCVAPRRGANMGRGGGLFLSRAVYNAVKRGRGPILRVGVLAFFVVVIGAFASGRIGFDVTPEEFRLRVARTRAAARGAVAEREGPIVRDVEGEDDDAEIENEGLGKGKGQIGRKDDVGIGRNEGSPDRLKSFSATRRLPEGRERTLPVPEECAIWRGIAVNPRKLRLYRRHFTSLDFTDWFLFVTMFNEQWHIKHRHARHRPVYVDVAANHARRWSNTYFFDRCMGWDGVCAEANPSYHTELRTERHCHLIDTCVSDMQRQVNFSFTEAYGGVVRAEKTGWGVNGGEHATQKKYNGQFTGFRTLTCTTLGAELPKLKFSHVDFMSLDVEGYELPVLQGIDWTTTVIDVLIVENKRMEIVEFLRDKGYTRVRHVLKDDVYIRTGSGYRAYGKFADWLKYLDKTDHRFHIPGVTS